MTAHATGTYQGTSWEEKAYAEGVGFERVVGRIGGRAGTFVLQHNGTYADGKAKATWLVVPGSGTGALTGLRGEGGFVGEHGQPSAAFTLDYDLE